MNAIAPFTLRNLADEDVTFAGDRPAIVCFVKED